MPDEAIGSEVAKAFAEFESIENLKICLLRAEVANPELPAALEALGAIVDDIGCYKTVAATEDPDGVAARLLEHGADWVTFTSASTVQHFHTRFDLAALLKKFGSIQRMRLASVEQIAEVPGFGGKAAAELKAFLEARSDSPLPKG